jgi:hypothetical protein
MVILSDRQLFLELGPGVEGSPNHGAWKQMMLTLRCPYCVDGQDYRPMIELSGCPDNIFFCSKCRHLARFAGAGFKCGCSNCQNANRDAVRRA